MIVLRQIDGIYRSVIVCDSCQQPINNIREANAISRLPDLDVSDLQIIRYVHQGNCTEHVKHELGGKQLADKLTRLDDNLEDHLLRLMLSVGLHPERMQKLIELYKGN